MLCSFYFLNDASRQNCQVSGLIKKPVYALIITWAMKANHQRYQQQVSFFVCNSIRSSTRSLLRSTFSLRTYFSLSIFCVFPGPLKVLVSLGTHQWCSQQAQLLLAIFFYSIHWRESKTRFTTAQEIGREKTGLSPAGMGSTVSVATCHQRKQQTSSSSSWVLDILFYPTHTFSVYYCLLLLFLKIYSLFTTVSR